jgi:outer membrane protein assembly factor BamB
MGVPPAGNGGAAVQSAATQRAATTTSTSAKIDANMLAWPQLGFDSGHSGYNPKEMTLSPQNVAKLKLLWSTPTDNTAQGLVSAKGVLYGESSDMLYALNTKGTIMWSIGGMNTAARAPAVAENLVLASCSTSQGPGLCAYENKNGAASWSLLVTCFGCGLTSTPTVEKHIAYAEYGIGGTAYDALNAKTGALVWDTGSGNHCSGNGNANADPVAGGMAYYTVGCVGTDDHTSICAFNAKNGTAGWCTELGSGCGIAATHGVSEAQGALFANVSYSGSCAEQIVALNAKSGTQEWAVNIQGNNPLGPTQPAVAKGVVYDIVGGSNLEAFSAKSGSLLWTQTGVVNFGQGVSIANGVAYTLCGGTSGLCAINAKTGKILWSSGTGGGSAGSLTTPVILNGVVYASCGTANFCAFGLSKDPRS